MSTRITRNSTKIHSNPDEITTSTIFEEKEENETFLAQPMTLEILSNQLKLLRADIADDLSKHKDEIITHLQQENTNLKNELELVKKELKKKSDDLVEVERDVIDLQQYIRRNNIEICGIPESVDNRNLEKTVIKVANVIGVQIDSKDIEACHRLAKRKNDRGPQRTIVRFVNRKNCESLHRNKKKLTNDYTKNRLRECGIHNNVYINSNLSPYNKFIWGKCKHLHDEGFIDRFWVYNGFLHIAEHDEDKGEKISHLNDLQKLFPNVNLDNSSNPEV